eukprot:3499830-Prymnesium_polylepis.1
MRGRRGAGGVAAESRSQMSFRSSGVQVHAGLRAALEARAVPIGLGAARGPLGVTLGRRQSAQEACPDG